MNDCNGKRIALNSRLKCINDVEYGKIHKVVRFADSYPILGIMIDECFYPLKSFEEENGCLIDFEVVPNGKIS